MSLNRVELIGNLTKDPEVKAFPNGGSLASFSIATNRTYKTDDGEKKDVPEYHNVVVFGKMVDVVSNYLRKGSKVFVEGRLQTRSYEAKDGSKRYSTEIVMQQMIMLNKKEGGATRAESDNLADDNIQAGQEVGLDDLPF